MNEKIEQEAEKYADKLVTKHTTRHNCLTKGYIEGAKFAHNAALSEAIEKVKRETSETHRDFKAWTGNEIIELLEGLKK